MDINQVKGIYQQLISNPQQLQNGEKIIQNYFDLHPSFAELTTVLIKSDPD